MKYWPLWLLAVLVGPLSLVLREPFAAFVGPVLLAVVSTFVLSPLPRRERLTWGTGISSIATMALFLTVLIIGARVGRGTSSMGVLTLFWLPWFLLFSLPLAFIAWRSQTLRAKALTVLGLLPFLYLGSALLTFDFRGATYHAYNETPDRLKREPALGPRASVMAYMIAPPQGPCFLFSCDYDGSEWIWKAYQPLVKLWFDAPGCHYYDPDKAPVAR